MIQSVAVTGLDLSNIFLLASTDKIRHFSKQGIQSLEDFAIIHLPDLQFYLPWAIGQCDLLSPVEW